MSLRHQYQAANERETQNLGDFSGLDKLDSCLRILPDNTNRLNQEIRIDSDQFIAIGVGGHLSSNHEHQSIKQTKSNKAKWVDPEKDRKLTNVEPCIARSY